VSAKLKLDLAGLRKQPRLGWLENRPPFIRHRICHAAPRVLLNKATANQATFIPLRDYFDLTMHPPRILYLEDDESDVLLLRRALVNDGVEVELVHVRTPWDFSAALKSQTADLILLDGKVAGFGGVVAMRMARVSCPGVPSFCLTGSLTDEKVDAMRRAGAVGCLSKQDLTEVSATIRRTLENSSAPQSK
jgi:CheY-like chemotaxis protein